MNKIKNVRNFLKKASLLSLVFLVVSCSDFGDLNVDPNNPTSVPAANLFTQGQFEMFNRLQSRNYNGEWTMLLTQHWAQNEYAEESRYVVDGNTFDAYFQAMYASSLSELDAARKIIEADETVVGGVRANQLALIEIMSINAYTALTEAFGSIPYSQALSEEFPNPAYDDQSTIYPDLLDRLNAAVGSIDTDAGSFGSGDVVYGGDAAAWKKLGASMLLRMALRVADVDSGLAQTHVSNALSYGVFESNADNAVFAFSSDPALSNPLYIDNVINGRDDFCVTDVLVNALNDRNDPRVNVYAAPNNDGKIVGMRYGLLDAEAFAGKDTTSRPAAIREFDSPHIMMDYAEVSFCMAEAIERGYATGNAADHYANGVTASMNFWGITDDTAIADYIANNAYDSANWKNSIGMQKWLAFYGNGHQAWTEWRRLDVPSLDVPAAADNPAIPVRLPYPVSEQERNGNQLSAVTSMPNDMDTKLWFDVN
jgi:hypothetical protein